MMRILTILLLPLLFIATSCDSGGEGGTACSINPTGSYTYESFELDFSDQCSCTDADNNIISCDELGLAETMLSEYLQCALIEFQNNQAAFFNFCGSADDEGVCDNGLSKREIEDCLVADTYTCQEQIIITASDGMIFNFNGSTATGGSALLIDDFLEKYLIYDEWNNHINGDGCSVDVEIEIKK